MGSFVLFIRDAISNCVVLLSEPSFSVGGSGYSISFSYFDFLLGFCSLSVICSVFWKGGRG